MTKLISLVLPLALLACNGNTDTDAKDTDVPVDTDTTEPTDTDTTDPTDTDAATESTVVEAVIATDRFSSLEAAVIKADLAGALTGVTVFAPNDDAFAALFTALGVDGVDDLSVDQLTAVLTYHVVAGEVDSTAAIAAAGTSVASLGGSLDVTLDGDDLFIDAAQVITADIGASDGIIHEIDAVLLPSVTDVVSSDPELSTLFAAIGAVDADDSAPGLGALLNGAGTFTLLAPNDVAFGTFLDANDSLSSLGDLVGALGVGGVVGVLQYHVFDSQLLAADVIAASGMSVDSLGGSMTINADSGSVVINEGVDGGFPGTNDATVVVTDILTSNGVIHKMDRVILPAD
jgi:transforming growth factor-beta-induced protein